MGFTVIVNVLGIPAQLLAIGVTVIIAVIGKLVELLTVNEPIFPLPEAGNPMVEFEFTQLKLVPVTALVKFIELVFDPLQSIWLVG